MDNFTLELNGLADIFEKTNKQFGRMWAAWCALNVPDLSDNDRDDDFVEIKLKDLRRFAAVFMHAGSNNVLNRSEKGGE